MASRKDSLGDLKSELSSALDTISRIEGSGKDLPSKLQGKLTEQILFLGELDVALQRTRASVIQELDDCSKQIAEARASLHDQIAKGSSVTTATQGSRLYNLWFEKSFVRRSSLLTEMLQSSEHYRTIYNIAVAVLILLFIQIAVTEILEKGEMVSLDLFVWAFGPVGIVFPSWVALALASLLIVPLVQGICAFQLPWRVWAVPYVGLQLGMTTFAAYVCLHNELSVPSGLIVVVEQVRMAMKIHAYLREKLLFGRAHATVQAALRLAREQPPNDKEDEKTAPAQVDATDSHMHILEKLAVRPGSVEDYALYIPGWALKRGVTLLHVQPPHIQLGNASEEIGRYLYFFFAPTLVYRDEYPRERGGVRWVRALTHVAEMLAVILYCYVLLQAFVVPTFSDTPTNPGDLKSFIESVFRSMLPGMMVLFMLFFGILHVFFNLFAVILRHADRRFYENWWSTTNWSDYYRKWNAVVHEFLRTYLYFDLQRFSKGRLERGTSMAGVFVLSAFIHEWIIAVAIGFWFPVLLVLFGGPGVYFMRLTRGSHGMFNVFMWTMLSVGTSLLLVLYSREWYARHTAVPVLRGDEYGALTSLMPHSLFAYYRNFAT